MTITIGTITRNGHAAAVTSLLVILVAAGCGGEKAISKDAATVPTVAALVPFPEGAVGAAIRTLFGKERARLESPFDTLVLAEPSDPVFPDDEQIKLHVAGNEPLARFAAQLPAARGHAFYLSEPTGNVYWPSEYVHDGKPADFRSAFIVHLRTESENATTVEVIEYQPMIKVGRRFRIGHNGPGFYADIRDVEPTARDRQRMLEAVTRGVGR